MMNEGGGQAEVDVISQPNEGTAFYATARTRQCPEAPLDQDASVDQRVEAPR
jgi:hypothetical protein